VYGLYRSGFQYWFEGEEIQRINAHNIRYAHISGVEEMLLLHYTPGHRGGASTQEMTSSELLQDMRDRNWVQKGTNAAYLGKLLVKHGFPRRLLKGMYRYKVERKLSYPPDTQDKPLFG